MQNKLLSLQSNFLSYLKNERGFSNHTIKSYSNDLNIFIEYCLSTFSDDFDIDLIDNKTLNRFKGGQMEKGFSSNTINRRMSSIKSFFRYLYNLEIIKDNPAKYLHNLKVEKRLPDFIPENKIIELMNAPLDEKRGLIITNKIEGYRDKAILELFYATGLRLSELININICDVDKEKQNVKVMGKGGKERIVPIGKVALYSIESYLKMLGKSINNNFMDPIFVNKKGNRLPKRTLQRRITKYLNVIMEGTSVHTLRHTFASHLINEGADILTIKELLGHSSISSTGIYTKLETEKVKKVYQDKHPHGK